MQKDNFYDELVALVRKINGSNIVVVPHNFNTQVGKLGALRALLPLLLFGYARNALVMNTFNVVRSSSMLSRSSISTSLNLITFDGA